MRNKLSNGPLRAQSNVHYIHRVFCDVRTYVSCREYVGILLSARVVVNQGGTADYMKVYSPLTD